MADPRADARRARRFSWLVEQCHGRVLDAGCGPGVVSVLLARRGLRVDAIDVDLAEVGKAQAALRAEPAEVQDRITLRHGSIDVVAPDERFDTVLLAEVLEHQHSPEVLLRAAAQHLAPGGRVVLTTPFGWMPDPGHVWAPFPSDVHRWLTEAGLTVRALDAGDAHIRCVAGVGGPDNFDLAGVLRATERAAEEAQRFWIGERDRQTERVETLIARSEALMKQNEELNRRIAEMRRTPAFRVMNKLEKLRGGRS